MGRPKGSLNKATLVGYIGTSKDPAHLLLRVLADEGEEMSQRMDAAKTLMPYVHRKQPTAVETSGDPLSVINFVVRREF